MSSTYDMEAFARIVLFQLASIRTEVMNTRRDVAEILAHQNDATKKQFESRIRDQELKMEKERDRIFAEMLKMVKLPPLIIPPGMGDIRLN